MVISGIEEKEDKTLARFDFLVTFESRIYKGYIEEEYERVMDDLINEMHETLSTDFSKYVRDLLGDEVLVRIDKLEKGSVVGTITLVLVSALSAYTYISQYKDFVESLELIRKQLYSKMMRSIGNRVNLAGTTMSIVITKIPYQQTQVKFSNQQEPAPIYSKAFFWYLFVSNIVLIVILGSLLYKAVVSTYFVP